MNAIGAAAGESVVDAKVAAFAPSERVKSLSKGGDAVLLFPIILLGRPEQEADPTYPVILLCARRERPRDRRAAEQSDELAASHHEEIPTRRCGEIPTPLGLKTSILAGCRAGRYHAV
jgi:hypothetical protein